MATIKWNDFSQDLTNKELYGTNDNDSLVAYGGESSVIFGLEGDDIIRWFAWAGWGNPNYATIDGGPGNDSIYVCGRGLSSATKNTVFCGDGDDYVEGAEGDDSIWGGSGTDVLNGGDGIDVLVGGEGNDSLYGGYGDDSLTGDAADLPVSVHGADYLDGFDGNDHIWGNAGDDTLLGGNGNDSIWGKADNDLIYGGDGDDVLVGCEGSDTIYGGAGDDKLTGDASDLDISTHGSDWLYAGEGNDNIWGNAGDDSLGGGTGADWLYGGEGNDKLWGSGVGDDKEMDVFVFRANEGPQVDEIMDFESGYDGVWVQDAVFTKAEVHGNDLWAYVGDDRGLIIHNAVGKELKYFDASCTEIRTCKL